MKKRCDYCGLGIHLVWNTELKVHFCPKCKPELENALRHADWIKSLGRRR